ncbi:hypothetical protein Tco_1387019 [Tanacetum coccineum]
MPQATYNTLTSKYIVILGRTIIHKLSIEVSTIRSVVEFPTEAGIATVRSDYLGRDASLTSTVKECNIREIAWKPITAVINAEYPNQPITIDADLPPQQGPARRIIQLPSTQEARVFPTLFIKEIQAAINQGADHGRLPCRVRQASYSYSGQEIDKADEPHGPRQRNLDSLY